MKKWYTVYNKPSTLVVRTWSRRLMGIQMTIKLFGSMPGVYVGTRAKFIQYIKELGVASSLTYRGIVTFFSRFYPPISIGGRGGGAAYSCSKPSKQGLWGDQQSKSSSVCYSSHRWKRPLLYATRSRCPCARQMDVKTLAQLYIYEKLRWISYKCVYMCVCPYWIWVALVTPLFEAGDRSPGGPRFV